MNSQSSRSHSIFTITVFIKEKTIDGEETIKVGKLNLVDLAGSENIERSGATGKRAAEAGKINKSLTTLGRVITALVEHRDHIPYRESNLTRLLQDSLGGRTKTSIIATISPAQCNFEETLSTLDYAYKAKSIKNKPEVNQKLVKKALIKEYTEEIERLKGLLFATREKNGIYLPAELYQSMEGKLENQKEEIRELLQKINGLNDEIDKLQELFKETKDNLIEKTAQLIETQLNLKGVTFKLENTEQELDENKYLLQEQVATEINLHGQADQLLKTAKISINDCTQLHDKIDRKTNVEKINQISTSQFSEQMFQRNAKFNEDVNVNLNENKKRNYELESNLEILNKRLIENKDENVCSLSIFHDQQENWSEEQTKLLNDGCLLSCLNYKEATLKQNANNLNNNLDILHSFKESLGNKFEHSSNMNKNLYEILSLHENLLKNQESKLNEEMELYEDKLVTSLNTRIIGQTNEINEIRMEIISINNKLGNLNEKKSKFEETLINGLNFLKNTINEEFRYIDDEINETKMKLNIQVGRLNYLEKKIKSDENEIISETKTDIHDKILKVNNDAFKETFEKISQVNIIPFK